MTIVADNTVRRKRYDGLCYIMIRIIHANFCVNKVNSQELWLPPLNMNTMQILLYVATLKHKGSQSDCLVKR